MTWWIILITFTFSFLTGMLAGAFILWRLALLSARVNGVISAATKGVRVA